MESQLLQLKGYTMHIVGLLNSAQTNLHTDFSALSSDSKAPLMYSTATPLLERIKLVYLNVIRKLVVFIVKYKWMLIAGALGSLLTEPWASIKSGFLNLANLKKDFHFYNMNPLVLTEEQQKHNPILLLHGDYHNQTAWLSFAQNHKAKNLQQPLFTVNLPAGEMTHVDDEIIHRQIDKIKELYKKYNINNVKIDIVGHSRGSDLSQRIAWTVIDKDGKRNWKRSEDIGKIVKIGGVLKKEEIVEIEKLEPDFATRVLEISGKYDILEPDPSSLKPNHWAIINCGHVELLFSREMHQRVFQWLS